MEKDMFFWNPGALGKRLAFLATAFVLAACGGNSVNTTPVSQVQPFSTTYALSKAVTFINWPPAAGSVPAVSSFDISFVDPTVGLYYVADRNNAGVSVISTATQTYLRTAGAGSFQGYKPAGPGGSPATNAGPNGLVSIGNGIVFAGDGNSTLKVVNATTGLLLGTQPSVNPYTGVPLPATCGGAGTPTTGAGNQRLDEMGYDPADGVVLAINDAACPPFGTFFSTTPPYNALGSIAYTTANGGAEQPTWDPSQKQFIQPLPSTIANPNGEVDLIDPNAHTVTKTFGLASNCQPNGTALGLNETLFLGCSATGEILTINATTGATINTISGYGGCDEVWYSPTANRFYAACSNNASGPMLVVADGTGTLITTIPTSTGAHSVAVDPGTDTVYLPTQKLGVQLYGH
jgi:hypothetical protein